MNNNRSYRNFITLKRGQEECVVDLRTRSFENLEVIPRKIRRMYPTNFPEATQGATEASLRIEIELPNGRAYKDYPILTPEVVSMAAIARTIEVLFSDKYMPRKQIVK